MSTGTAVLLLRSVCLWDLLQDVRRQVLHHDSYHVRGLPGVPGRDMQHHVSARCAEWTDRGTHSPTRLF